MEKDGEKDNTTLREFIKLNLSCQKVKGDPRDLSDLKKNLLLTCLVFTNILPGFASTIYMPALPDIRKDLNASSLAITCSTSLFMLFLGIAPLFWASLSEHIKQRRVVFLISISIHIVASIISCFLNNIWLIVAFRCVQAFGSSCGFSVGSGTITDCWGIETRGTAMGIAFFGQFFGNLVGPVIGGIVINALGWRAAFWSSFIYGVIVFVIVLIFFAETYRLNVPTAEERKKQEEFKEMMKKRRGTLVEVLVSLGTHDLAFAQTEDIKKPGIEFVMASHRSTTAGAIAPTASYTKRFDHMRGSQIDMGHVWLDDDRGSRIIKPSRSIKDASSLFDSSSPRPSSPSSSSSSASSSPASPRSADSPMPLTSSLTSSSSSDTPLTSSMQSTSRLTPLEVEMPVKKKMFFPFRPLSQLRYPVAVLIMIPAGIAFAAMFVLQAISPVYYQEKYHLNPLQIGLTYLSAGVASILSSLSGGRILDYMLARNKAKRGYHIPEDRITPNSWICLLFILPLGCLLFGWGVDQKLNLSVPVLGTGLANFAMTQIVLVASSYLIDVIPAKSASAVAALSFIRNTAACVLGLVSDPMQQSLGAGWIGTMLALLVIGSTAFFVVVKLKGEELRKRSNILKI